MYVIGGCVSSDLFGKQEFIEDICCQDLNNYEWFTFRQSISQTNKIMGFPNLHSTYLDMILLFGKSPNPDDTNASVSLFLPDKFNIIKFKTKKNPEYYHGMSSVVDNNGFQRVFGGLKLVKNEKPELSCEVHKLEFGGLYVRNFCNKIQVTSLMDLDKGKNNQEVEEQLLEESCEIDRGINTYGIEEDSDDEMTFEELLMEEKEFSRKENLKKGGGGVKVSGNDKQVANGKKKIDC